MTTPARQVAYDAADKVTTVSRRHVEAIVDAALNALAGPMYIAPRHDGVPVVWVQGPQAPIAAADQRMTRDRLWVLLEAVIPTRDESSAGVACEACGFEHDEDEPHLMDAP